jgi:predicted dehydrogenase
MTVDGVNNSNKRTISVCLIGATGHYAYAVKDAYIGAGTGAGKDAGAGSFGQVRFTGIAPGYEGEYIGTAINELNRIGSKPEVFSNYNEMLERIKPDVAVIASRFNMNAGITIDVLSHGCSVFVEKPLATTLDDLDKLKKAYTEAANKNGSFLATMFGIRYTPSFLAAWKAVKEGLIGEVRLMNAQKSYKFGKRESFYRSRETYGGTIPWVGIHAIDWLRWFSGEDFKSVYSSHTTKCNKGYEELEMTALCHFEMSNDVFGSVTIDYLRPDNATGHGDDRIRVVGAKGIVEVLNGKAYLTNNLHTDYLLHEPDNKCGIFSDFIIQLTTGRKCIVSAEDSFAATEAALMARLSADNKRVEDFKNEQS